MLEVGSSLRRSREAQGLSLADAEKATRVRVRYLRALEEERFDELPGGSYPRVFLRDYATYLGLEPDLLLDAIPAPAEPEIAPRPEPPPLRSFAWRHPAPLVLLGGAAVALLLWVALPGGHRRAAAIPHKPVAARPVAVRHVVQRPARPAVAVLRAARGDCWILVRRGDTIVWSGILRSGRTLRLPASHRLWLRLGAPWNLDMTVAGKPVVSALPHTPVNVWLSQAGLVAA